MKVQFKEVKDYLTKSNLPTSDYVINPYIGCPHACKYCYASFMKRFTNHPEPWGSFIDIKQCDKPIDTKKLIHKSVFLSSVTDCYNPYEETYEITRGILKQLIGIDCEIGISTKSKLILRDIDILKQLQHLKVSMSINTLDETFKGDMDTASSIEDRLHTLQTLHEEGIYTILFMSPIFPGITDFKAIIEASKDYVDEIWFENLNLRGGYKQEIVTYIAQQYPEVVDLYDAIYRKKDMRYWEELAEEIDRYCIEQKLKYMNFFYHSALVEEKKKRQKEERVNKKKKEENG